MTSYVDFAGNRDIHNGTKYHTGYVNCGTGPDLIGVLGTQKSVQKPGPWLVIEDFGGIWGGAKNARHSGSVLGTLGGGHPEKWVT